MTPLASRRRGTEIFVTAVTRLAGPSQRDIASYQMPMLRILWPLRDGSCRQCMGASGSTKLPWPA